MINVRTQHPEPAPDLLNKIIARIRFEQRVHVFKRKLILWSIILCLTFGVAIPVYGNLQYDMHRTGFDEFLSIFASDWDSVSHYWQDLVFSLLESFPLMSGTLFFGLMLLFLWSIRAVLMNSYHMVATAASLHKHQV